MYEFDDVKQFLKYSTETFKSMKFISNENRRIKVSIGDDYFHFDNLQMLPLRDDSNMTIDQLADIAFGINKEMRHVKGGHKEWDERLILNSFFRCSKDYDLDTVIKYETPDFIVDCKKGYEVLNYKTELQAIFSGYMKIRKSRNVSLKELKRYSNSISPHIYDTLIKLMRPTLKDDNDTVIARSGFTGSYSIDDEREKLVNRILSKKLDKYNNDKYQLFDENYLICKLENSTDLHQRDRFDIVKEINLRYPNIKDKYKLIIVVIDNFAITIIDLYNDTVKWHHMV